MPAPTPAPATLLFFDHTAKIGGGEIALFNLVAHLDRALFEPVVVLAEDGALRERLGAIGIETHVLPLPREVTQKQNGGHNTCLQGSEWALCPPIYTKLAGK